MLLKQIVVYKSLYIMNFYTCFKIAIFVVFKIDIQHNWWHADHIKSGYATNVKVENINRLKPNWR